MHPRACLATLTARPGSAPEENHPLRPGARADLDAMASIFDAAASGDIGAMNGFMDADDFEVDAKDALGNTALHCAAKNGEAAAGGLLVECSADVNLVTRLRRVKTLGGSHHDEPDEPVQGILDVECLALSCSKFILSYVFLPTFLLCNFALQPLSSPF